MIGVIATAGEKPAVEEFFELFKTPWEFYRTGQRYDVVIASGVEVPEVQTKLLLIYSSHVEPFDERLGVVAGSCVRQISLDYGALSVPIYGDLLTFEKRSGGVACLKANSAIVGLEIRRPEAIVVRLGYDLFQEVQRLLSAGQPVQHAHVPTLECHIAMLREWMLSAGIRFIEIPPSPAGYSFIVCLTHDIDFVGIKKHKFDHTICGFLYRSTVGAIQNFFNRRISFRRLLQTWRAVVCLPFVYLGWAKDFWLPFEWYLQLEKGLPATYFFIPFKGRSGKNVTARDASKRAAAYDISDLPEWTTTLSKQGCEIGVHGIDSWHDVEKGREELARIAGATGESRVGVRIHWLLHDRNTFRVLEEADYAYDSTLGYNETIGYRNGSAQAFRPEGAQTLLELPLHIQDGALFYPHRLDLSELEAWERCAALMRNAKTWGGVLTVLWHDRSHGPERFWGDFYARLVRGLKSFDVWFGSAAQVVSWFRKRREARFESVQSADGTSQIRLRYQGEQIVPPLKVMVHNAVQPRTETCSEPRKSFSEIAWSGGSHDEVDRMLEAAFARSAESRDLTIRTEIKGQLDCSGHLTGTLR